LVGSARATTPPLLSSALKVLPLGCNTATTAGTAHCYATALGRSKPNASSGPTGLGPTQIQSAYKLAGLNAAGRTVAIVDAYDDKTAESDLATYRSAYGLPACTTANGCFKKTNQNGGTTYPKNDVGWATEISLDLDAVSAACPTCKILLVEASSPTNANLYTAVDTAARTPGVVVVSNSYGGGESAAQTTDDAHFNHPGIAITVSSGDSGYGVEYPAASKYVTAVGGTTLTAASNVRGWTETAWSGAGSGCSAYDPKPAWQTDSGCARRTVADVSAVADPASGLGVYDTNCNVLGQLQGTCFSGWAAVGGTSLSSPIIASVYALAPAVKPVSALYGSASLFDVTSGSNGSCSGSYLCTGTSGFDGPTGNGTPNGVGAF
jgi:subtilase family serine protease